MPDTTSRATRAAPRPPRRAHRSPSTSQAPSFLADLTALPGVPCPCGTSRRAFVGESGAPCSIHRVEISRDAQAHYHKRLTEIYYFLEGKGHLELDGVLHPVRPGMAVLIRPGTRHRAVVRSGAMTILNVVVPQFDPRDEWLDP
jgi:mannose-6-phosphate isomerase-like protein (cupin superfamily)